MAEKLGRFVYEIEEMPNDEFVKWALYFGFKAQMKELAAKQAKGG